MSQEHTRRELDRRAQRAQRKENKRRGPARLSFVRALCWKGNCYDNAVVESFFGTLKTELIHHHTYATREEARMALFEYLEVFYNRKRRHSALDYRSPADYETSLT